MEEWKVYRSGLISAKVAGIFDTRRLSDNSISGKLFLKKPSHFINYFYKKSSASPDVDF